jgi:hypothetical protein
MTARSKHIGSGQIHAGSAAAFFSARLVEPGGWFWGRIGGSDFDAVARLISSKRSSFLVNYLGKLESRLKSDRNNVRQLNGFFDLNAATFETTFQTYISTLDQSYGQTDGLLYGGRPLIDHFNGESNRKTFSTGYADALVSAKDHMTYEFIEAIHPFFATTKDWMAGKKVLVVSPFSRTIELQFSKRDSLFQDFRYPSFDLVTYDTPITYNNAEDVRNSAISSRTSNWVDELALMKQEIRKLDFDVALLSCGSYAGPLGVEIASQGKKAIYIGGVLNVLFNIFGQRYNTEFVKSIINTETTIDALETSELMARSGGKAWANEALRAYLR